MFSFFLTGAFSAKWAVLYAGSNTWWNYRHQADICNIYQQLKNRGFDDEHIVMAQYDDITTASFNPYKGQIFHTPEHVNIYPGASKIDYSGARVNAKNFYNILTTLPSTSEDYVFVYYDNHGGPGILGVPDGCGDDITAKDLNQAFIEMANKKLYKKLFFSIEACYSGSIGEAITAPNMFVLTAANNQESSYAAIYDNELQTYLSNEFSDFWMTFIDAHADKTIGDLFERVKAQTVGSHVMCYGDMSIKSMKLSTFLGMPKNVVNHNTINKLQTVPTYLAAKSALVELAKDSRKDVAEKAKFELRALIEAQEKARKTLTAIAQYLEPTDESPIEQPCGKINDSYYEVLKYFTSKYGHLNGDDLPLLSVLVNLSNKHTVAEIKAAIDAVC